MPGLVQSGNKRPSIVLSEDDDDDQSGYASSVSVASKRARHARDASHRPAPTNGNHARNRMPTSSGKTVEAEFPAGSLLRVKLRNFVTYTAAEFHLGPSLNMIIGPNGTGKSTLVCAICLGLGWGSEHLGRAKDIGLFVKNGSNEAEIEIELAAGSDMDRNPVVRRFIRKEDNKSIFWINGKQVPKNAVLALCKKFSIQIDNLCQFLPQDRVVEFSKMKPEARLKETLRAAAPPQIVEWYDQLKELRVEEKGLETGQQNEQKHLEKLERAQAAAQDDVDRFQQREGLMKKARCLAMVKPIIELRERKENVKRVKEDLTAAKRELEQINADVEPVQQAQVEAEAYKAQIEEVVKARKNRMDMIKAQADQIFAKIEKEKQVNADTIAEVAGEVKSKKDRERDIARVNGDIQRLERQRQEEPVEYDAAGFDQRRAELRSELSATNTILEDRKAEYEDQRRQVVDFMQEDKRIAHQREQLNTQVGKQASVLATVSRDTVKAWEWFKANQEQLPLKGQVCGPAILECSVRDPRYAQAVESQLRKGDLVAITCTNADDQKLLSNHFLGRGSGGLGLHDVHLRTSPKPLSAYPPPIASTGLADLGFEGYIIDYLNGPDAVLAMLCDNARLNRIAYAPRSLSDEQHAAVSNSSIQKWVSGKDIYQITTRREYGVSSTSVTQLKPARCFVDQPANTEEMRELDEALRRNKQGSAELKEKINNTKQQMIEADQKMKDLRQARDELQTEQDRFKKVRAEWDALPSKIGRQQEKLDELLQENAQTKDRIRAIQAKARQASLKAANFTLDYTKVTNQIRTFYESLVEAEVRLIEANSEIRALTRENEGILQKLQRKKIDVEQLKRSLEGLKAEYTRLLARTQQHLNDLDDEEKAMMNEYQHIPTIEALDQEAAAVNARLEMMAEGNHGVLRAFEKRKEEIAQAQEKLEEYTTSLDATKEKITGIRTQWEPQLDALISKISDAFAHNFQQIACAGEVRVYKDEEDFNNWSVQISVRFREGEQLSVLDDNRQSGGERAVSTVFYLMALQDLAQSPFRVVDEINQGMDPRNERKVHERMVDIACQEHTSQYFLVTPKLLTGLKFHPKMKVHIINSGEHVPDAKDAKTWDLRSLAKVALRTRKGIEVS